MISLLPQRFKVADTFRYKRLTFCSRQVRADTVRCDRNSLPHRLMASIRNTAHILLVEDDLRLAGLIREYLEKNGFRISHEIRGDRVGSRLSREQPDLIILDVMLPGLDGFAVCREIRPAYRGGVIMLTARDEDYDELLGLELGADDYIRKPVEPRLLLARIHTVLRRLGGRQDNGARLITVGDLRIDHDTRQASLAGESLDLSTAEFDLLALLASQAGKVLSRDDLLRHVRGLDYDGADRSIDLRVSRLRRKLGDDPRSPQRIKTVRGRGYLMPRVPAGEG